MPVFFEVLLGAGKNHFRDGLHQSLAQRLAHTGLSLPTFFGASTSHMHPLFPSDPFILSVPPPPALEHLNVAIN